MSAQKPVLGVVVGSGPPAPTIPPQAGADVPLAPATPTPPQAAPEAPPPVSATPPQEAPDVPPPEPATPPKDVTGLPPAEPPPPAPQRVVVGLGQQAPTPKVVASRRPSEGQPVQSCAANALGAPVSDSVKREYLTAVKTYEQQVGPNTVRGKMIVECLPTTPKAMPDERRFSPQPETRYGPDMGPGSNNMYVPMSSGPGYSMGAGAAPNLQGSCEEFLNLAHANDADFAKMAEMVPQVVGLLDMKSHIDQILDITNMPREGRRPSGYAEPTGPVMAESYDRPPPPCYGAPIGRYSVEACPRDPSLYMGREPRMAGRPSYEGQNYARRPCSRERTAYVGENRPTRRSMSRASDLLDRIRQDIDKHRAEKLRADAASIDDGEPEIRIRSRRNSLPHDSRPPSRNVRRASYDDDARSDRRAPSKPRRHRSRRLETSSSSSSSSGDRSRSRRSKRSKDSKGKKSRRHSKKSSSSSSSSSSGSRSKSKPKGRSVEFVRKVTKQFSASSTGPQEELGEPPQRKQYQRIARSDMPPPQQQYLPRTSPSNTERQYQRITFSYPPVQPDVRPASPKRGMNRSAEKGIMRTQSKTACGTLFKYGVEKEPIEDEEATQGVQKPQGPQVMSSGGSVYRYESHPSVHPH